MTICKYPLMLLAKQQTLNLPDGAQILTVQSQGDAIVLWALVDQGGRNVSRTFRIVGTGCPADDVCRRGYIGTVRLDIFVWHVFEVFE